jgi:hypothetical protein
MTLLAVAEGKVLDSSQMEVRNVSLIVIFKFINYRFLNGHASNRK